MQFYYIKMREKKKPYPKYLCIHHESGDVGIVLIIASTAAEMAEMKTCSECVSCLAVQESLHVLKRVP